MHMHLGEHVRLTLFGSSHGPRVGAIINGLPQGIEIDENSIQKAMDNRRPGGRYASKRREPDVVQFLRGVEQGRTTGEEIEISIANKDARSKDYSFLPNHPRPGHQDLVMHLRTKGEADLRGGGTSSARLTAALVASAALLSPILEQVGIHFEGQVGAIGTVEAKSINECPPRWASDECQDMRCRDPDAAIAMIEEVEKHRLSRNSIGSRVDLCITGMPLGVGEPWFDGLEPALARAMMSIPASRGVEFGRGFKVVKMTGIEHNDPWGGTSNEPILVGERPDGILAGLSTGSPIHLSVAFKPPSSISSEQHTLNIETNSIEPLVVKGRHDPVLGPRAVAVVEAMAKIIVCDLAIRGGFLDA
jgi:chorismate synthase